MIRFGIDSLLISADDIQETGGHINDADCLKALQAGSELLQNIELMKLITEALRRIRK